MTHDVWLDSQLQIMGTHKVKTWKEKNVENPLIKLFYLCKKVQMTLNSLSIQQYFLAHQIYKIEHVLSLRFSKQYSRNADWAKNGNWEKMFFLLINN